MAARGVAKGYRLEPLQRAWLGAAVEARAGVVRYAARANGWVAGHLVAKRRTIEALMRRGLVAWGCGRGRLLDVVVTPEGARVWSALAQAERRGEG